MEFGLLSSLMKPTDHFRQIAPQKAGTYYVHYVNVSTPMALGLISLTLSTQMSHAQDGAKMFI